MLFHRQNFLLGTRAVEAQAVLNLNPVKVLQLRDRDIAVFRVLMAQTNARCHFQFAAENECLGIMRPMIINARQVTDIDVAAKLFLELSQKSLVDSFSWVDRPAGQCPSLCPVGCLTMRTRCMSSRMTA